MSKRLKVLLLKPFNLSDHIQPALGLGYLATAVRENHDIKILDCIKEKVFGERLLEYIRVFQADIVGFQIYTYDLARVRAELKAIKEHFPLMITVAGGPHPSALAHDTIRHMRGNLDFVFCGEAERSFPKFLDLLASNASSTIRDLQQGDLMKIPGLTWVKQGQGFSSPPELIQNLDQLGFPAWDLIRPHTYPEAQHGAFFKNFPIAPIMTGRGCPCPCTFCAGHIITGRRIRKRSVENVIEEIKILTRDYRIREIHIVDDNFTIEKKYVMNFCEQLLRENIKISWATPNGVRIDSLDREMLLMMKKSGYYLASVGIEFGSERMLQITEKHLTQQKIREGIELIRGTGLDVAGFFMIGYPGERKEEIEKTIEFALSLPLIRANFFIFLPLPGTEVYQELEKKLELGKVDWEHFYFTHPAYTYGGFSPGELKNFQRTAFLKFYLRPHIFLENLKQIKSIRQFKYLLRRGYRWILAW